MKKHFITLLLAFGLTRLGHAQTYLPDTIRVNKLTTTYLIFPGKVSMVDISPEYLIKIESGNIVFVRPRLTTARKTPIFVRTDNATYLGYLTVSGKMPPAFVEVSKLLNAPTKPADRLPNNSTAIAAGRGPLATPVASPTPSPYNGPLLASLNPLAGVRTGEEERPATEKGVVRSVKSLLQIRMDSLLSGPATHHDVERNSGISVRLTHLVHDTANTYLQLSLGNKTAMPFLLDQVSFWYQHQAKKRKGAYLDGETYPMEPVIETMPERVEAGQTVSLRFALPQFAPQSRSSFVINVREKTGTRNVTMTLPMREVLYARPRKPLLRGRFFQTQSMIAFLRHEPKR
ncbi:hypothetical protein A6C57_28140 (plasmid) [Fibrella sp. ES10-3-2-2]